MSAKNMTLEQLQKLCDASIQAIEKVVPSTKGRIFMTAISDPEGKHGDGSYMYPNASYHMSKCFINLYDSSTRDQALQTIAHELVHSLLYRFEHYQAVITPLLMAGSKEAMDKLYYQTSENFADMLSPIIYHYLKGVVK